MFNPILPSDLSKAEEEISTSLLNYLRTKEAINPFISINLKFDGLRLNPIVERLCNKLKTAKYELKILYSDAGSSALAKRDLHGFSDNIYSFSEFKKTSEDMSQQIILVISPQHFDVEEFELICQKYQTTFIMINGKLEDPIVGVGQVGRERRKRFNNSWKQIYYLEPMSKGALKLDFPNEWQLFSLTESGYSYKQSFADKPDEETIYMNL